jgi:alpha-methylacyl-CoA racemase
VTNWPEPPGLPGTPASTPPGGPLHGARVLCLGGIGPAQFCSMVLADLGGDVVFLERPGEAVVQDRAQSEDGIDILGRGVRRVVVDLKDSEDRERVLGWARQADVVIEGFRPGVAERLGLGPETVSELNPRVVYTRVTGYGQTGPLAQSAGHDINFIARTGLLHAIGRRGGPPQVPLNVVGDYGGGGMLAALGVCAALLERATSGSGHVIDAAMTDGVALLMASVWEKRSHGHWNDDRGTNPLDTGAPTYDVYETADGKWMAVGSREPLFRRRLLESLELTDQVATLSEEDLESLRALLADRFRSRTQAEWTAVFADVDACVSPVLSLDAAGSDAAFLERGTYRLRDGHVEPGPAPRFSRTAAQAAALDR